MRWPSMRTVQVPQAPSLQPFLIPVSPADSRSQSSSVTWADTCVSTASPLTVKLAKIGEGEGSGGKEVGTSGLLQRGGSPLLSHPCLILARHVSWRIPPIAAVASRPAIGIRQWREAILVCGSAEPWRVAHDGCPAPPDRQSLPTSPRNEQRLDERPIPAARTTPPLRGAFMRHRRLALEARDEDEYEVEEELKRRDALNALHRVGHHSRSWPHWTCSRTGSA